MFATTRMLTLSTLFTLLVGLLMVHQADAEGRFRPRGYSEENRLRLKESCKEGGGTSFETNYHYDFGSDIPTRVTTTCHGGKKDGSTCEVGQIVTCGKSVLPEDQDGPFGGLPSDAVIEEIDASSSSETAGSVGGVLATPGASSSRPTVTGGTRSTVILTEDDEQP